MMKRLCVALLIGAGGCYTATTTSTAWTELAPDEIRPGHVEAVREVVHEVHGNPAAGALVGALIGGALFHGDAALFGAAAGAGIGAAASSGASAHRTYEVRVRFDDGEDGVFVYEAYAPFQAGQRVVLTSEGLQPG